LVGAQLLPYESRIEEQRKILLTDQAGSTALYLTEVNSRDMVTSKVGGEIYPPELTASESEQLLTTIKDWSIAYGLAVRPPPFFVSAEADPQGVLATTVPVTLFPSPFPRVCFEQAKSVQKAYNRLYASIAQDEEFLQTIVLEQVLPAASDSVFFVPCTAQC